MTEAEELELLELEELEAQSMAAGPEQPKTSALKAAMLGATELGSAGFASQLGGGIQAHLQDIANSTPKALAPVMDLLGIESRYNQDSGDVYRDARDDSEREIDQARKDQPAAFYGAGLPAAVLAGLPMGVARGLGAAVKAGAAMGGLSGLGSSKADLTRGELGQAAVDTGLGAALGAGLGAAGHAVGSGLGWLGQAAGRRAARLESTIDDLSEAAASAETRTARSAAGNKAQAAYRTAELTLKDPAATTAQREMAEELLRQQAANATPELANVAAERASAGAAFRDALRTQAQRAEKIKADRLSGKELSRKVGERAKRYGLPAVVGSALGGLGLGPLGAAGGFALGGAAGAAYRPMMHSLLRLAKDPDLQYFLAKGAAGALGGASKGTAKALPAITQRQPVSADDLEVLLPLLASEEDPVEKSKVLAEALRKRKP